MTEEENQVYNRTYYENNKEKLKAAARIRTERRRKEKPEECKAAVKRWYNSEEGKAKRREYFKTYQYTEPFKRAAKRTRAKNKDKILAQQKIWRQQNPDKNNAKGVRYRASKLKRVPSWLTKSDWIKIQTFYSLARRKTLETSLVHHVDHIIPLQGELVSGLHVPENLQVILAEDNLKKSNSFGK